MSESLLKKEFRERDVQRMRNIVQKKYGNATATQVGYQKADEDHVEGDIWEENEKMWTIKNGLKQSYTKLDSVKKTIRMPLVCPSCQNRMRGKLDQKSYMVHETCHLCQIKVESEHKRNGTYEQYVKQYITKNLEAHIDEAEQFMMDFAQSKASNFVTEDGDIEETVGDINKVSIIDNWKKELDEMREKIKKQQ